MARTHGQLFVPIMQKKITIKLLLSVAASVAVFLFLPNNSYITENIPVIVSLNSVTDAAQVSSDYHLQHFVPLYSNQTLGLIYKAITTENDFAKLQADSRIKYAER